MRITFDDGHDTGLYSWDLLHDLGRDKDERLKVYRETLRLRALRDEALHAMLFLGVVVDVVFAADEREWCCV